MRSLNVLIDEVNVILDNLTYQNNEFNNLVYLQVIDGKTFPVRREQGREGTKISPIDTKQMVFYHRLISEVINPIPAKGAKTAQLITYNLRLTGVGYRPNFSASQTQIDNADVASNLLKLLAEASYLSGREFLQPVAYNSNKTTALQDFNGNEFTRTKLLDLYAFYIDYTIKAKLTC